MSERTQSIIPERITQAREYAGLSKSELARQLDISPASVTQWESGVKQPTVQSLQKFALAVAVPMAMFGHPMPAALRVAGPLTFRARKSLVSMRRANLRGRRMAEMIAETYLWISRYVSLPENRLPDYSTASPSFDEIQKAANQLRREWGLGDRPILKLGELLESKGLVVASVAFGDQRFDAFSCIIASRPLIFLGSEKQDNARSRFDAAHELGHLVLHQHYSELDLDDADIHKRVEREAHEFGGAFLMPAETFSRELIDTSLNGFLNLKPRWAVSAKAMIKRARMLELISAARYTDLNSQMSRRGMSRPNGEPLSDAVPPISGSVGRKCIQALQENNVLHFWQIPEALPLPLSAIKSALQMNEEEFMPPPPKLTLLPFSRVV